MSEDCPICNKELKQETMTIDWLGPIAEHYAICPNKCYSYEYAYGYTTIQVTIRGHNIMFGWSYSDDKTTMKAESDAIDTTLEAARLAQAEDKYADQAKRPQEPR